MKYYIFSVIAAFAMLTACSDDMGTKPESGDYCATISDSIGVSVTITDGYAKYITVDRSEDYSTTCTGISTTGSYPTFTYNYWDSEFGISIEAEYSSLNAFTAKVYLYIYYEETDTEEDIEVDGVSFSKDSSQGTSAE